MKVWDFTKELEASRQFTQQSHKALRSYLGASLKDYQPNEDVALDKQGADAIVTLASGRQIYVDYKADKKDNDNICLELWSSEEHNKLGWSCDNTKITDVIVYLKPVKEYALVFDFKAMQAFLRNECNLHQEEVLKRIKRIANKGYTTVIALYNTKELLASLGTTCWVSLK